MKDENELYKRALLMWGEDLQINLAIEELSELITELSKYLRFKPASANYGVIEELADAEIMIEQMKQIFNCEDSVKIVKNKKLKRLAKRINEMDY